MILPAMTPASKPIRNDKEQALWRMRMDASRRPLMKMPALFDLLRFARPKMHKPAQKPPISRTPANECC